jgi:hypothetical protein
MRTPLLLLLPLAAAAACSNDIMTDNLGDPSSRVIPPNGAITGTVTYLGPRPCSANGHIIGNALVLVFDRRNPPPPAGLAVTAINFAVVEGDVLFANEPRWGGSKTYCPVDHGFTEQVSASGSFAVGPLAGASYVLQSFYDYTGNFLPNFKFRELPEKGDVGGGAVDVPAALQPINQNPNYTGDYVPVDVGIPRPVEAGAPAGTIPLYDLPSDGYVADNVQVTLGHEFTTTRPYFFAQGMTFAGTKLTMAQSSDTAHTLGSNTGITGSVDLGDPNYAPILTIPQDIKTFAPPVSAVESMQKGANLFEQGGTSATGVTYSGLPHLRLVWSAGQGPTKANQNSVATAPPFNMQIAPFAPTMPATTGSIDVWRGEFLTTDAMTPSDPSPTGNPWWQGQYIPEGFPVPFLWPLVVLSKLVDDPGHANDPASLTAQGDATHPVVILQGITLTSGSAVSGSTDNDSLFQTASPVGGGIVATSPVALGAYLDSKGNPNISQQDHVTAMIRPAVICFNTLFDNNNSNKHGNIVTPYLTSESADFNFSGMPTPKPKTPVVPLDLLTNNDPSRFQATPLVEAPPGWKPGTPPAVEGCLPTGRYAINLVYPDGQAWTVPNEAGACTGDATGEGGTDWTKLTCTLQQRPVIRSQGVRAVVEIVKTTNPKNCVKGGAVPPVPPICLPVPTQ